MKKGLLQVTALMCALMLLVLIPGNAQLLEEAQAAYPAEGFFAGAAGNKAARGVEAPEQAADEIEETPVREETAEEGTRQGTEAGVAGILHVISGSGGTAAGVSGAAVAASPSTPATAAAQALQAGSGGSLEGITVVRTQYQGDTDNAGTNTTANTANNDREVDLDAYAREVVRRVNRERAAEGLPALEIHDGLMSAAQVRAEELVVSFSHTRPNGQSASAWARQVVGGSYGGENIANGYQTPAAVMTGWMNSSGHKANILRSGYDVIGVGCYESGGRLYWVQLFSRERASVIVNGNNGGDGGDSSNGGDAGGSGSDAGTGNGGGSGNAGNNGSDSGNTNNNGGNNTNNNGNTDNNGNTNNGGNNTGNNNNGGNSNSGNGGDDNNGGQDGGDAGNGDDNDGGSNGSGNGGNGSDSARVQQLGDLTRYTLNSYNVEMEVGTQFQLRVNYVGRTDNIAVEWYTSSRRMTVSQDGVISATEAGYGGVVDLKIYLDGVYSHTLQCTVWITAADDGAQQEEPAPEAQPDTVPEEE